MQKWIKIFFTVYLLVLIKLIVFKYPYRQLVEIAASWKSEVVFEGLGTANFVPLKTIKMYIKYSDRLNSFENLAGNILAFIPFGMLYPFMNTKKKGFLYMALSALLLIAGIELFQLISAFGAFDVDDIILNFAGAALGYAVYLRSVSLFPAIDKILKTKGEKYGADFEEN